MSTTTATETIKITKQGLEELNAELKDFQEVKLPAATARKAEASKQGDLRENSEYQNAKEEQDFVQARIGEIVEILSKIEVVSESKNSSKVSIGSHVKVQLKGQKKSLTYHIVGEYEADPREGKISSVSPLGKALFGKKKGDAVKFEAPAGTIEYLIEEIG